MYSIICFNSIAFLNKEREKNCGYIVFIREQQEDFFLTTEEESVFISKATIQGKPWVPVIISGGSRGFQGVHLNPLSNLKYLMEMK